MTAHHQAVGTELTAKGLPQLYSYVQEPRDAQRALDIIDLQQIETQPLKSTPLELQKSVIQEMAIAEAHKVLADRTHTDIKVLKLDQGNSALAKVRNESGFKLLDANAVKAGQGSEAELVTVVYARVANDREKIVPLVFAHVSGSQRGWHVKEAIDNWCIEVHGDRAENLITSTSHRLLTRFVNKINEYKKEAATIVTIIAVLSGGITGISHLVHSHNRNQEIKLVEYNKGSPQRMQFIKATLESIKSAKDNNSKGRLLNNIQMEHYDTIIEAMNGSKEQRMEAASVLAELVHQELTVKRSDTEISRKTGPNADTMRSWSMEAVKDRSEVLHTQLQLAFNKEVDPEVRTILVKALEEVSTTIPQIGRVGR